MTAIGTSHPLVIGTHGDEVLHVPTNAIARIGLNGAAVIVRRSAASVRDSWARKILLHHPHRFRRRGNQVRLPLRNGFQSSRMNLDAHGPIQQFLNPLPGVRNPQSSENQIECLSRSGAFRRWMAQKFVRPHGVRNLLIPISLRAEPSGSELSLQTRILPLRAKSVITLDIASNQTQSWWPALKRGNHAEVKEGEAASQSPRASQKALILRAPRRASPTKKDGRKHRDAGGAGPRFDPEGVTANHCQSGHENVFARLRSIRISSPSGHGLLDANAAPIAIGSTHAI